MDYTDPADPGSADDCWTGVGHFLNSVDENGRGICGFDEHGDVDRDSTDVDPENETAICDTDPADWAAASPRVQWDDLANQVVPVFVANGGGDDETIVENAELVPLQDAKEFAQASGTRINTRLCTVDTKRHGTHFEFDHCNDESEEVTVLASTAEFINDNLSL